MDVGAGVVSVIWLGMGVILALVINAFKSCVAGSRAGWIGRKSLRRASDMVFVSMRSIRMRQWSMWPKKRAGWHRACSFCFGRL